MTQKDLPSTHNVVVHIHNEFVAWLKKLKGEILVSKTLDLVYQRHVNSCTAVDDDKILIPT